MRKRFRENALFSALSLIDMVVAGSSRAHDALGGNFKEVQCTRCGARISMVYICDAPHHPAKVVQLGGDCLASLTGDPSTQQRFKKTLGAIRKAETYEGQRVYSFEIRPSALRPGMKELIAHRVDCLSSDPRRDRPWTVNYGFTADEEPMIKAAVAHWLDSTTPEGIVPRPFYEKDTQGHINYFNSADPA